MGTNTSQLQSTPTTAADPSGVPTFVPPRKKRKWVRRLIVILIIVALLAAWLFSTLSSAGRQLTSALYLPATVDVGDITVQVSGTAVVEPNRSHRVTAQVTGEILEAPFQVGDTVEKGDVLYRIDSSDLENSIAQAELSVEQARLNYENLAATLEDSALTATDAGLISKLYVEAGDYVSAGAAVADIVDRDTMTLELPFHRADAQSFQVGQTAVVSVAGTTEQLTGTITAISALDEVTAGGAITRQVTIQVANPGALTEGTTGSATVNGTACAASGTFACAAQSTVYARTSGTLTSLSVAEGDRVSKGQVLGTYGNDSVYTQVESARLSLEAAELTLKNTQDQLDNYTITAPISGTIVELNYQVGDTLEAGAGYLAVLFDMTSLTFDMNVDELYIAQVQEGQEVSVTAEALDGVVFTGHVETVNINGTTAGGVTSYPVTVVLDGDTDGLLPGMNVSADILVETAQNVLRIPVGAVQRGNTVLVAGPEDFDKEGNLSISDPSTDLTSVPVELGRNDDDYIEVLSGLSEGDIVVIENEVSSIYELMGAAMSGSFGG